MSKLFDFKSSIFLKFFVFLSKIMISKSLRGNLQKSVKYISIIIPRRLQNDTSIMPFNSNNEYHSKFTWKIESSLWNLDNVTWILIDLGSVIRAYFNIITFVHINFTIWNRNGFLFNLLGKWNQIFVLIWFSTNKRCNLRLQNGQQRTVRPCDWVTLTYTQN